MAIVNSHAGKGAPDPLQAMQADIEALARDLACDATYVAEVYRNEHSRLSGSARLPDFVPLFAARFTRDRILRDRRGSR